MIDIKKRRLELNLGQKELAEMVGVKKAAIGKWENNIVKNMKSDKIIKLAKALKVDPYELLVESNEDEIETELNRLFQSFREIFETFNEEQRKKIINNLKDYRNKLLIIGKNKKQKR